MTAQTYIEKNDFEGALTRFNTTSNRWKNYWWNTLETIFNQCTEWGKKYILDPVRHIVTKLKKRGRPAHHFNIEWKCNHKENACGAYLIRHYKNGVPCWKKVGKADNVDKRLRQHFTADYPGRIDRCEVVAFFPCADSNVALTMENVMREYFQKKSQLLGNDRFADSEITAEDVEILTKKHKLVQKLFK